MCRPGEGYPGGRQAKDLPPNCFKRKCAGITRGGTEPAQRLCGTCIIRNILLFGAGGDKFAVDKDAGF